MTPHASSPHDEEKMPKAEAKAEASDVGKEKEREEKPNFNDWYVEWQGWLIKQHDNSMRQQHEKTVWKNTCNKEVGTYFRAFASFCR
jgi:hypothetical protein